MKVFFDRRFAGAFLAFCNSSNMKRVDQRIYRQGAFC
jgi:hypothetical protein